MNREIQRAGNRRMLSKQRQLDRQRAANLPAAPRPAPAKTNQDSSPARFQWQSSNPSRYFSRAVYAYSHLVNMGFKLNPAVYAAIMYKMRAVTQAPLYAHVNDDDNPVKLPSSHSMQRLMLRPNPNLSGPGLQSYRMLMYNIAGNSYIWIERDASGEPVNLWPLRPDRVSRTEQDGQLYYVYAPPRAMRPSQMSFIPEEDMIHDKYYDPTDTWTTDGAGFSPLQVAARNYLSDNEFTHFISTLTQSGMMPASVITRENDYLTQPLADALQKEMSRRYSGVENWGTPIILPEGLAFESVPMALQEELFRAVDARNETRVVMVLGVDTILLRTVAGMDGTTYTNMVQAQKDFWNGPFAYDLTMMAASYDLRLNMGGKYRFMFDKAKVWALSGDIAQKAETYNRLISGGVPPNWAARQVGIDIDDLPDGYGDKVYFDARFVPADRLMEQGGGAAGDAALSARIARLEAQLNSMTKASQNGHGMEDYSAFEAAGFLDELEARFAN